MTSFEALPQQTTVGIVGGGPAGIMLGYLLARAGVDVVVLEKHKDFLRDFRGDTIHPATLQLMRELGLLDELLTLPHDEVRQLTGQIGKDRAIVADFSHFKSVPPFIALMPQWDFLNFLARKAGAFPSFKLGMECVFDRVIYEGDAVAGIRYQSPAGVRELKCGLVVGADGRHSKVRQAAGLEVQDLGAPIDVLWMRISREASDPQQPLGMFQRGHVFVLLSRQGYWQCAFVIPKGEYETIRTRGIEAFQQTIRELAPFFGERVRELKDWNDISLLTVRVDRLKQWAKPGLLCIGDSAHAMSPIGGVGINLAIQDAVATSNILTEVLRKTGKAPLKLLEKVQKRRTLPTLVTQAAQVFIQNRIIVRTLQRDTEISMPLSLRLLTKIPGFTRIPAYMVGIGARPEHARIKP